MAQPLATDATSAGDLTALACLTRMFDSEDYPESAERQAPLSPGAESRDLPGGTTVLNLQPGGSADGRAATELVERVRDIRGDEPVEVTGVAARLVDFRAMLGDRASWAAVSLSFGFWHRSWGAFPRTAPRICCPSGRPACWTWGTC
ncbi:hypothetical protein OHB35_01730 [Streptomyces phaeochromogenes]|uniref:Uncharacterized protein n=1 Tax=Streptomyces phaeochromogenes TaxID=1923 RepID=A0ABZ1H348_STRPH|nr:hypothetical protein [Streptomyces phaeochromogenes]WSD12032.1 hypothetical protein OHB35_01730 [Streptomyces phaeochromogenes]